MSEKLKQKILRILLLAILFFVITPLLSLLLIINPSTIQSNITPNSSLYNYEDVTFQTSDGLNLHGWFIEATNNPEPETIIFLHGYPAEKGDVLPFAENFVEDYNLFLFDFRSLGKSDGRISTIGLRETKDVVAALDYLENQKNIAEAHLWGFSMGAATALMSAEQDSRITSVVADSSFANLSSMARESFRIPVFNYALGEILNLWALAILGTHPSNVSPENSLIKLDIPVLIIHSKDDQVIPFSQALRLESAVQESDIEKNQIEFWFRENGLHGTLDSEYTNKINQFLSKSF